MPRFRLMAAVMRKSGVQPFFPRGLANRAADSDRAVHLPHGNLAFGHLAQQFEDEERTLLVVIKRALEGLGKGQLHDFGWIAGDADAIDGLARVGGSERERA